MVSINTVLDFITQMPNSSYWFARTLASRFAGEPDAIVVYSRTHDDFGCRINGKIYNAEGMLINNEDYMPISPELRNDSNWCYRHVDLLHNDNPVCGQCRRSYCDGWGNRICEAQHNKAVTDDTSCEIPHSFLSWNSFQK